MRTVLRTCPNSRKKAGPAALTGALLGLSGLFVSLLLPAATARAADRPHPPTVVAHRGASAYAPENTLAAVDAADDLGIGWVETDVQRTRDGQLVIMHDTTLKRTTDVEKIFPDRAPWNVSDFTLAEIEKLDAGSWFGAAFAGEGVPTLREYLRRVSANHQKLLLEIKSPELYPGIEWQLLGELLRDGWLDTAHVRDDLVVQSFDADSVQTVHQLRPDLKTGFLGTPDVAELPAYAAFADQINPSATTITSAYVAAVHAVTGVHGKPLEVDTWTVDDGPTALSAARMGVDGVISNKPDVVHKALDEAGDRAPAAAAPAGVTAGAAAAA
jgi:glycerophosphoryl diester phosphodiesterase